MNLEERVKKLEQRYNVMETNYLKMVFAHHHSYRADMATIEGLYLLEKIEGTAFAYPLLWEQSFLKANSNLRKLAIKYIESKIHEGA